MTAKRSGLLLAAYCVAQLLVVLDSSIMTVALPSVAVDLGLGPDGLPWVVSAFAVPIAGLLLLAGRLADLFGAHRVLLRSCTRTRDPPAHAAQARMTPTREVTGHPMSDRL